MARTERLQVAKSVAELRFKRYPGAARICGSHRNGNFVARIGFKGYLTPEVATGWQQRVEVVSLPGVGRAQSPVTCWQVTQMEAF